MLVIYHNPRCSKSRAALALTQQFADRHQLTLDIVDYQETPLTLAQLLELHGVLQADPAFSTRAMLRENEDIYAELQLAQAGDAALMQALAAHPILLQRPIVRFNERAVIARPPELVHALLLQTT